MCNCKNKSSTIPTISERTTLTNCNGLRKRLIKVKNKVFVVYKSSGDNDLLKLYQDLSSKLKKIYYCPDYLDVISLEDEYLNS